MTAQNEQMHSTVTQQLAQIQQHKDQYNILKLKLGMEKSRTSALVTGYIYLAEPISH